MEVVRPNAPHMVLWVQEISRPSVGPDWLTALSGRGLRSLAVGQSEPPSSNAMRQVAT